MTVARKIWMRDDDPRHFVSLEEMNATPLPEGPLPEYNSYFQVMRTPEGRKFFFWGRDLFALAQCLSGSGLKMTDRIDVKIPRTYRELRELKASFKS